MTFLAGFARCRSYADPGLASAPGSRRCARRRGDTPYASNSSDSIPEVEVPPQRHRRDRKVRPSDPATPRVAEVDVPGAWSVVADQGVAHGIAMADHQSIGGRCVGGNQDGRRRMGIDPQAVDVVACAGSAGRRTTDPVRVDGGAPWQRRGVQPARSRDSTRGTGVDSAAHCSRVASARSSAACSLRVDLHELRAGDREGDAAELVDPHGAHPAAACDPRHDVGNGDRLAGDSRRSLHDPDSRLSDRSREPQH